MPGITRIAELITGPPDGHRPSPGRPDPAGPWLVPPSGNPGPPTPSPAAAAPALAPSEEEAALALSLEMTGKQIKTVLLVEDDEKFSEMMRVLLEGIPFRIEQARNGAEAIKRVLVHDFDYILCDMVMPEFPGEMFYRAVERARPRLCPRFIFMTGYRNDEKIHQFIKAVSGLILWKPFKFSELLEAVRIIDARVSKSSGNPRGP